MHSHVHISAKQDERQALSAREQAVTKRTFARVVFANGLTFAFFLGLLVFCTGFGPPVLTDGGYPPVRLAPEHIDALLRSRTAPTVTAASALMIDLESGQTLFEKAPTEPRSPASTAKLMTALVVVDQVALNETVLVTSHAAETEGSRMGLVAGERLTVSELLHGLLIPSGNDAAVALAEYVAGSEPDFVQMMNARARAMGLSGTNFVNVHGLDAAGQTTTAADMAVIARDALANDEIAKIVTSRAATVAGHTMQNTNELLGTYAGADGVKTGTTDEAGECLIASVTRAGRRTLLVELGSRQRFIDATKLFDYARDAFAWQNPSLPDSALAWANDGNGKAYRLRSDESSDIFVPAWQRPLLLPVVAIQSEAVMTGTSAVGELRWMFGSEAVARKPLSVWQGP